MTMISGTENTSSSFIVRWCIMICSRFSVNVSSLVQRIQITGKNPRSLRIRIFLITSDEKVSDLPSSRILTSDLNSLDKWADDKFYLIEGAECVQSWWIELHRTESFLHINTQMKINVRTLEMCQFLSSTAIIVMFAQFCSPLWYMICSTFTIIISSWKWSSWGQTS